MSLPLSTRLDSPATGVWIGGAGLVLFVLVSLWSPAGAIQGWLVVTLFFLGLSLGAVILLAIANITGGHWSEAFRPALMAIRALLPLPIAAMLLPILGASAILSWRHLPAEALSDSVRAKAGYFAPAFLSLRTLVFLALWLAAAWAVARPVPFRRSVLALVVIPVTMVFFATDWMMGPEPEFYSTIYPLIELSGEIVGAFAVAIIGAWAFGGLRHEWPDPESGALVSEDLGNLFFGFVLLWVYLAFMQWLIIWSGNLPDEIGWYLRRSASPWPAVLIAVVLLHAILPIAGLLSGRVKRSPTLLAILAAVVLAGHALDVVWRVAPGLSDAGLVLLASGAAAFMGIGGIWLAGFVWLVTENSIRARWSWIRG
jgi:hypothetical protein